MKTQPSSVTRKRSSEPVRIALPCRVYIDVDEKIVFEVQYNRDQHLSDWHEINRGAWSLLEKFLVKDGT
jgi:hypothetical protein